MTSVLLLEHRDAQPQYSCYRYDKRCYCFLWPTLCTQTLGEARWAADHLGPFVTALILRASPSVALLPFHNRQELNTFSKQAGPDRGTQQPAFTFFSLRARWVLPFPFYQQGKRKWLSTSTEHPEHGSMPGRDPKTALQLLKISWAWWQMVLSIIWSGHHTQHHNSVQSLPRALFVSLVCFGFKFSPFYLPSPTPPTLSQTDTKFKHTDNIVFLQNLGWKKVFIRKAIWTVDITSAVPTSIKYTISHAKNMIINLSPAFKENMSWSIIMCRSTSWNIIFKKSK